MQKDPTVGLNDFLTCFYQEMENDLNATFFFFPNLYLFQILPWVKKRIESHASLPSPTAKSSCFLVRMKSSSSGHTLALPNTCTLTLITRDKRNTQWDSMKRSSAGCFFESFLSPMVCFCVPLDTVQHRSRMFSRSRQFVFSEIRTCGSVTNGVASAWEISGTLCWWVALCIVCIHTGGTNI